MSKKNTTERKITQSVIDIAEKGILSHYARWKEIYENGSSDPNHADGVNLNLVRNHIIYMQKTVESTFKGNFLAYPDSYYYPIPTEVSPDFMVTDRKLAFKEVKKEKDLKPYSEMIKFDWKEALS